ncbi:HlyD family type I secretion periplasmic adaptor subunit [Henriciella aquimarina]|uniref:HlyD family type I secretion periplasmic adaptor subunit n=1 Tax=Henriciella aquimarina TaxID=545261 RepID=UPI0009FE2AB9|nr:HlyD family type I secretion periplasmic adaptor subunit [Henriciella aquimarina]
MAERTSGQMRGLFILGFAAIALVFGGLLAWAVIAPFEGAVIASGQITVESRHKAIQHLEGGIVDEIHVQEGDLVEQGDLLIRLDGTGINSRLATLDARLVDLLAREARLKAELEDTDMDVRDGVGALAESDGLARSMAAQRSIMAARAQSRATQISILRQKIEQLQLRARGLEAEVRSTSEQAAVVGEELTTLEDLLERGLVGQTRVLALKRERSGLAGKKESLLAEIAQTEVQIGEARLEIIKLTDGFRETVSEELSQMVTEINSDLEEKIALLDQQRRLEIRAPRRGRVFGVKTHTLGGVIAPGDPVMSIVPEDDRLVAMVRILPQDIDKVFGGQATRLRFSAFSQRRTPEVDGEIIRVGALHDARLTQGRDAGRRSDYADIAVERNDYERLISGEHFARSFLSSLFASNNFRRVECSASSSPDCAFVEREGGAAPALLNALRSGDYELVSPVAHAFRFPMNADRMAVCKALNRALEKAADTGISDVTTAFANMDEDMNRGVYFFWTVPDHGLAVISEANLQDENPFAHLRYFVVDQSSCHQLFRRTVHSWKKVSAFEPPVIAGDFLTRRTDFGRVGVSVADVQSWAFLLARSRSSK